MIIIRPVRMFILARRYGLHFTLFEIKPPKNLWGIYEVRKNILSNNSHHMLIYDTSYYKYTQHLHKRRTVVVYKRKERELTDVVFGYASERKIEKFIRSTHKFQVLK